ncbi:hypothetical protein LH51_05445 [Nitrincola sp. A-D6]|uniref:hypothetical protein n=1 Tax=Nitrincola sp. A-D6 TaxID=1545442 RepID=UPI00051FCDC7|nr:hypothetical protein [Nitrincola sp. A-D6]KGK42640.1 hypothetical protein LH51_05445 [Nitrincola sp. A-D6]
MGRICLTRREPIPGGSRAPSMAHRVSQIRSHQPHQSGCLLKVGFKSVFVQNPRHAESLDLNYVLYAMTMVSVLLSLIFELAEDCGRGGGITLM